MSPVSVWVPCLVSESVYFAANHRLLAVDFTATSATTHFFGEQSALAVCVCSASLIRKRASQAVLLELSVTTTGKQIELKVTSVAAAAANVGIAPCASYRPGTGTNFTFNLAAFTVMTK